MIDKVVEELGGGILRTPSGRGIQATWEDEKKVTGTPEDIASKVKAEGITRHALIIVGRAIGGAGSSGMTSLLYDKDFKHGYRKR
jgi:precorrin-4/cobalt-precorrin-4 C11-methyltransferase